MNTSMAPFLGMLMGAVPLLLVYMVGIVLAVVWWGRWPQVCGLVFAGCAILLVIGIVQPLIQSSIVINRTGTAASIGPTLAMLGMIATIIRAVGFGLLIWGAFAGRPMPIAQLSSFKTLPARGPFENQ